MQPLPLDTPERRRRAVTLAVALTSGTALAPPPYEMYLLTRYQDGVLTIDEVSDLLDLSVYQVCYHSRATAEPDEAHLAALLGQARASNGAHQVTGLLLYSAGRYVQVLEGPEADVRALYGRIQQDPRHAQVVTVSAGPVPQRHFADWRMGFGHVAGAAVDHVLATWQVPAAFPALAADDVHLQALLQAFSQPVAARP